MKVKDLIKKLKKVNSNLIVIAEGCDCINIASAELLEGNKTLLISCGMGVLDNPTKEDIDDSVIL